MAESSKIQWTDATWNCWHGCVKVSTGCKFCYMYRDKERYGQDPTTVLRSKTKFNDPLKWKDPKLIFTCSWSDFFIEQADPWRDKAWEIIKSTPHHTYQILTKRPERIDKCLPDDWDDWGEDYKHVWIGVSGEDIKSTEHRLQVLIQSRAMFKFLSAEPLLEPIHTEIIAYLLQYINWCIIGGESGSNAGKYRYRPCRVPWIQNLIRVCDEQNLPVFVKQLGSFLSKEMNLKDWMGGDIDEWPRYLQRREIPH